MKLIQRYNRVTSWLSNLKSLPLLFFRLILAYVFYGPATMKIGNISGIAEWFGGMGIPLPTLSAYLTTGTEIAAVVLLPLGLAIRLISIPLIFTMIVAIVTVHLSNGFAAGENGFEIPLYYILMLVALLINGAGKFSIDSLISKR